EWASVRQKAPSRLPAASAGLGFYAYARVIEEVAKSSISAAVSFLAVHGLPQTILSLFGGETQREAYLPALAAGSLLGAFCLTEAHSGSDAAALKTTATREGDAYVLSGRKVFTTNAGLADLYLVLARTSGFGDAPGKAKGISAFLVKKDDAGLSFGKKEDKMGWRSSPTGDVVLDQCRAPADRMVGEEGQGFAVAMTALDSGRITIGASAVGLATRALEEAVRYMDGREQFGRPIKEHQGLQFMVADLWTQIEASRLLVYKAARLKDRGSNITKAAAAAKLFATDAAMRVTTDAVQLLGGYGYMKDYPVERLMRDAKVTQIVEGTNQIQRMVLAREVFRGMDAGLFG
ncbi:MAG: acyl-CoA dehydrogenase, partial [Bauldia sp.]